MMMSGWFEIKKGKKVPCANPRPRRTRVVVHTAEQLKEDRILWCEQNGCCVTTMERFYICPCKECIQRREEEDNDKWEEMLDDMTKEVYKDW